jgi:hypothetical protein
VRTYERIQRAFPGSQTPAVVVVCSPRVDTPRMRAAYAVAEPVHDRRQHGERADHGREHDDHRPEPDRGEQRVAGDEHPGHRDQNRRARDQHRLPRRARAITAENARTTGSPAATKAPNASRRIATVSGGEVASARPMSCAKR